MDIVFKIQENFMIRISNTKEMLFIVHSNTFLQKKNPHEICFTLIYSHFCCLIIVLFSLILKENVVLFSNARSIIELMLCN